MRHLKGIIKLFLGVSSGEDDLIGAVLLSPLSLSKEANKLERLRSDDVEIEVELIWE